MIKITPSSKLYIWANTPEVRTGGAEVLHLLGAHLKSLNVDAKLFNYCLHPTFIQADYYKNLYDINGCDCTEIRDDENTILLFPEIMIENPDNLNFFINHKHAQFIFWWLSTSFDYSAKDKKTSKRLMMDKLKMIKDRSLHLYESEVAARDLLYHGLDNRACLQHGINPIFYNSPKSCEKEKVVMFNAMKLGTKEFVENNIMPNMPDVKFEGIYFKGPDKFLTKEEILKIYDKCMVYIDFCGFEGRELMPREACVRDCCLILGAEGNAATFDDYPIPEKYKVNKWDNISDICNKIRYCLDNHNNVIQEFAFFKNKCMFEPQKFEWCINNIFGPMIKKDLR